MKKLKFGIIGCSSISRLSIIPSIIKSKCCELDFIGSRSASKAKKFAQEFQCKNFGNYEDVLSSDVDIIYISTPVGLHKEWTIKCAKAGKHILCEKSSTNSYQSAKKMVESAKQNNVRLMEGLMFRFHPQHSKVLEILNKKAIGKIISFSGVYALPKMPYTDIRHKKNLGGGIINDASCYPICASRIVFNDEPVSVSCILEFDKKSKVDTLANIILNYQNKYATIITGYDLHFQSTYSILGNKGMIKLKRSYNIPDNENAQFELTTKRAKTYKIPSTNHFQLMIDSFCMEITGTKKAPFDFEQDLLNQAKILEAARVSNKKQKVVCLSDIK